MAHTRPILIFFSLVVCYLKLRHEDDPLTSPKNIAAIIYFSIMCIIGWSSSLGTIFMMIGSSSNPILFCQKNQTTCQVV